MTRQATVQASQTTTHPLSQGGLLQRKCTSCGQHKTGGGTCPKCRSNGANTSAPVLPMIQTKLTVGAPNDKYEQEADRVADQIMRMPAPEGQAGIGVRWSKTGPQGPSQPPTIQRKCVQCDDEQRLQMKENPGGTPEVTPAIAARIQALQSSGQPLSVSTRSLFEPRFGQDFSNVRVHTDSGSTQALNAKAYTWGSNIVFGAGHYAPATVPGQYLLAHELTHVLQQDRALVSNTLQRDAPEEGAIESLSREALNLVLPVGRGIYFELEGGVTWGIPLHTGGSILYYLSRISEGRMRMLVRKQGRIGLDTGVGASAYVGTSGRRGQGDGFGLGAEAGANFEAGVAGIAIEEFEFPVSELTVFVGREALQALSASVPYMALYKPMIDSLMADLTGQYLIHQRVELQLYAQATAEVAAGIRRPSDSLRQEGESTFVRDMRRWVGREDREFLSERPRGTAGDPLALLNFLSVVLGAHVRGTLAGGLDQRNVGNKVITSWFVEGELSGMSNLPIPMLNDILQMIPLGVGGGVELVFISEPGQDVQVKLNVYTKSGEQEFFRGSAQQQTLRFDLTRLIPFEEILRSIESGQIPQRIIDASPNITDLLETTTFWNRFTLFSPIGAAFRSFFRRQMGTRSLLSDRVRLRASNLGIRFEPYVTLQLQMRGNDFLQVLQQVATAGQQAAGAVSDASSLRSAFAALDSFLQTYVHSPEFTALIDSILDYAYVDQAHLRIQYGAGIGASARLAEGAKIRGDLRIEGGGFCELDYMDIVGQNNRINLRQFLTAFPEVLDNPTQFLPNCPFLREIYDHLEMGSGSYHDGASRAGSGQSADRSSGQTGAGELPGGSGGLAARDSRRRRSGGSGGSSSSRASSSRGSSQGSTQAEQQDGGYPLLITDSDYPENAQPIEFEVGVINGLSENSQVDSEADVILLIMSPYNFAVMVRLQIIENSETQIRARVVNTWWNQERQVGSRAGEVYTFHKTPRHE